MIAHDGWNAGRDSLIERARMLSGDAAQSSEKARRGSLWDVDVVWIEGLLEPGAKG